MANILVPIPGGRKAEIAEPRREDFPNTLGGAVEYTLAHLVYSVLRVMGSGLGEFFGGFLVHFLELIEPEIVDYVSPIIDELLSTPDIPDWLRNYLRRIKEVKSPIGAALVSQVAMGAMGTVTSSLVGSLLSPVTYGINAKLRPARPSIGDLITMKWRGLLDDATFHDWANDQGWPDKAKSAYEDALRPRPSVSDLIAHSWLTEKRPDAHIDELRRRGLKDDDLAILFKLSEYIPPIPDLITMAVREVFTPEVIEKYRMMEGFPTEFEEWANRRGLSTEWARRYWAMHWRLPSTTQGFEMLHRGVITDDELDLLLRTLDIMPFWREKLKEISYIPITRVDVRRMYKLGVIKTFDDLVRRYMDLGYKREDAEALAEFTQKYYIEDERELTKSETIKAYKVGRFTRDEAKEWLTAIDYPDWYAELLLDLADLDLAEDRARQVKQHVKTLYINNRYSKQDVHVEMGKAGFPPKEIEKCLEEWDLIKEAKMGRPSKTELRRYFKRHIIDEDTLRKELAGHQLKEEYINWFVDDLKAEMIEEAREAEEKAQKEAERIRKAKLKTDKDIALADLDLEIARLNKAIVDIVTSITLDTPPEEKAKAAELIGEYKRLIAEAKVKKAEIRAAYLRELKGGE